MNPSVVLGIAGTAKNTGKTTALNALLTEAHERRIMVGVTSIGYDGESVDNVTFLPKPRIVLHAGTIATTSRSCLPPSGWEVLESTGMATALGPLLIVRCVETGPIVLAGPSTRRDLAAIVDRMLEIGPSLLLIDGALNRLAPMSVASSLILSTGAARTRDLRTLARETAAIESILRLPQSSVPSASSPVILSAPFPTAGDIRSAVSDPGKKEVFLRSNGPIAPGVLREIAVDPTVRRAVRALAFRDPVIALLSAEPLEMAAAIDACRSNGIDVTVDRPLSLAAITINPFLPKLEGHGYVPDSVPALALRQAITASVRSPVIDVVLDRAATLWDAIINLPERPAGL